MANISLSGTGFQTIGFEKDPINPKNTRIIENDGFEITIRFDADLPAYQGNLKIHIT